MSRIVAIPGLVHANYRRHSLHAEDRIWVEKNCYVDLWIEIIHAFGMEPLAVMPFAVAMDFEGDQWTFYKPPHDELRDLYGVNVQEMNIWKPLIEHATEFLGAGKLVSTEADAYWLPDTAGTDYRHQHTKTTIVIADLDPENRRLGYFHNAGYFELGGEDFSRTFRLDLPADPTFMPLFAESVGISGRPLPPAELVEASCSLWRKHLRRVPDTNPVERFRSRFESELGHMQQMGLPYYHAWAFATTRQLGSAFELAAQNLLWLASNGIRGIEQSAAAFESLSSHCKSFILKGARSVSSRKGFDGNAMFAAMSADWHTGLQALPPVLRA